MSGRVDYLLRVVVANIATYDEVSKKLTKAADLYDATSSSATETINYTHCVAAPLRERTFLKLLGRLIMSRRSNLRLPSRSWNNANGCLISLRRDARMTLAYFRERAPRLCILPTAVSQKCIACRAVPHPTLANSER
jgi:hypothetical protein